MRRRGAQPPVHPADRDHRALCPQQPDQRHRRGPYGPAPLRLVWRAEGAALRRRPAHGGQQRQVIRLHHGRPAAGLPDVTASGRWRPTYSTCSTSAGTTSSTTTSPGCSTKPRHPPTSWSIREYPGPCGYTSSTSCEAAAVPDWYSPRLRCAGADGRVATPLCDPSAIEATPPGCRTPCARVRPRPFPRPGLHAGAGGSCMQDRPPGGSFP